jgi:hypothetical protein
MTRNGSSSRRACCRQIIAGWIQATGVPRIVRAVWQDKSLPPTPAGPDAETLWHIEARTEAGPVELTGRLVVTAQDGGVLLEERNGRLRQLKPDVIIRREPMEGVFARLTADELAADLLQQAPDGFTIHQTPHYVIATNSADGYADFCGRLLEKVHDEYFKWANGLMLPVRELAAPLPVMMFHTAGEFQQFARKQHPETSFDETPGYYSIRENQTLLLDLTRDRSIRTASKIRQRLEEQPLQVATVVHEAVHQLAFNTSLQTRMADNPLWITEGLATWFEPLSPRSGLLWSKPGIVNARHQPAFLKFCTGTTPQIAFRDLIASDSAFLEDDSVAAAYAESWALTTWLIREQPDELSSYLRTIGRHQPLQPESAEGRQTAFQAAFGKTADEMHGDVVSYIRKLRVPR